MINIIAAIDKNRGLGFNNELLVKLPSDMAHFKNLTSGHFIVQGRKTFESIGKPLPNRTNIILTRNEDYKQLGTFVYHTLEDVISEYRNLNNNESELFIIGGSEIFSQTLEYAADRVYLTIIEHEFENVDSYFPEISTIDWKILSDKTIFHPADDKNEYDHYFVTYERRK